MKYDEFVELINENDFLIVLDTNVILDLARYSLYTTENILNLFKKVDDKLYIPYQVLNEYESNKHKVFGEIENRYKSIENQLVKVVEGTRKSVSKIHNGLEKNYYGSDKLTDDIFQQLKNLEDTIKDYKNKVGIEYPVITENSKKIIDEIEKLVINIKGNHGVGQSISFQEMLETIQEGELRYKDNIPPGYMDEEKGCVDKFGDLFIWKEILKLPQNRNVKNIIFLTNDEKEDWWKIEKNRELTIREELFKEFKETNPDANIIFMTMKMFQSFASKKFESYE